MDFGYALKEIKKGNKVTREDWNDKDSFISLGDVSQFAISDDAKKRIIILFNSSKVVMSWLPHQEDLLSTDWKKI